MEGSGGAFNTTNKRTKHFARREQLPEDQTLQKTQEQWINATQAKIEE